MTLCERSFFHRRDFSVVHFKQLRESSLVLCNVVNLVRRGSQFYFFHCRRRAAQNGVLVVQLYEKHGSSLVVPFGSHDGRDASNRPWLVTNMNRSDFLVFVYDVHEFLVVVIFPKCAEERVLGVGVG